MGAVHVELRIYRLSILSGKICYHKGEEINKCPQFARQYKRSSCLHLKNPPFQKFGCLYDVHVPRIFTFLLLLPQTCPSPSLPTIRLLQPFSFSFPPPFVASDFSFSTQYILNSSAKKPLHSVHVFFGVSFQLWMGIAFALNFVTFIFISIYSEKGFLWWIPAFSLSHSPSLSLSDLLFSWAVRRNYRSKLLNRMLQLFMN